MRISTILIIIQALCLGLFIGDIGVPITQILAIVLLIPVTMLSSRGK